MFKGNRFRLVTSRDPRTMEPRYSFAGIGMPYMTAIYRDPAGEVLLLHRPCRTEYVARDERATLPAAYLLVEFDPGDPKHETVKVLEEEEPGARWYDVKLTLKLRAMDYAEALRKAREKARRDAIAAYAANI